MKKVLVSLLLFILVFFLSSCDDFFIGEEKEHEIYLLAVEAGYEGTYEEWLESIKGEKGDKGDKGEDGHTPVITIVDGYWYVDGVNTFVLATASSSSPYLNAADYGIKEGIVDTTVLNNLLSNDTIKNKTLIFPDGVYEFTSTIKIKSNWRIEGSSNTVFKLVDTSLDNVLISIEDADNVRLSNIKISGTNNSMPTILGDDIGISVIKSRSVNLTNLDIVGFSNAGIYSKTMSSYGSLEEGAFFKQMQIDNCRFYYNYYGSFFDYRCEYTQMSNCVFGQNYIGSLNRGGNNIYTSCIWNVNKIGFKMENSGSNPAHGGCNSCTFNHNESHAIYVDGCVNGWSYNGCQIFYGKIELLNSKGVIFDSNIWGSCKFISTNKGVANANIISNTYFLTDQKVILENNDGSTIVVDSLPITNNTVTITYKLNNGLDDYVEKINIGTKANGLDNIIKENYTFEGWYLDKDYTTKFDFNTSLDKDTVLYAKWRPNSGVVTDLSWNKLVYTGRENVEYLMLSTNAYSGASTYIVNANTKMDYVDFLVLNANKDTIINGVNIWVINSDKKEVHEKLVDNASINCIYSDSLNAYVIRINLDKEYSFGTYFVIQSTRASTGIAYYQDSKNSGYLRGDTPLIVNEVIDTNSNVVPVYVVYQK